MNIIKAQPLSQYRLAVEFSDGQCGIVDLSSLVGRGVFAAWLKPGVFEQVKVTEFGAVAWPGELDLCPDALYLQATRKSVEELFPSLAGQMSHA